MITKTPQTLIKAGRFYNSLEEAVKSFKEPLERVSIGLRDLAKYATFKESEEPYLLMVSQPKDKLLNAFGYNVMLTVTSYSDLRNQQTADQFEKETGIDLNIAVPEQIKMLSTVLMRMSFQAFEKNPKAGMAVLRGGI